MAARRTFFGCSSLIGALYSVVAVALSPAATAIRRSEASVGQGRFHLGRRGRGGCPQGIGSFRRADVPQGVGRRAGDRLVGVGHQRGQRLHAGRSRRAPSEPITPIFNGPSTFGSASRSARAASGAGMRAPGHSGPCGSCPCRSAAPPTPAPTRPCRSSSICGRHSLSLPARRTGQYARQPGLQLLRGRRVVVRGHHRVVDRTEQLRFGAPIVGFQQIESLIYGLLIELRRQSPGPAALGAGQWHCPRPTPARAPRRSTSIVPDGHIAYFRSFQVDLSSVVSRGRITAAMVRSRSRHAVGFLVADELLLGLVPFQRTLHLVGDDAQVARAMVLTPYSMSRKGFSRVLTQCRKSP